MKPLSIIISAFGSYAEETIIDMERLGQNGIYLITGDTGSGKTTIFDAITFALYGEASGSIREKKMLRSKYASPKQKTFVKMRFLNNGKTYTITRSPEYERAKEKGEGTTKQAAEAMLEFSDGRPPITKEKEATAAIEEILGINMKQFSQIAMIAQGDFLKLLLSETKERIEIFRNIFDTEHYKNFQDKLSLEAKTLESKCTELKNKIKINLNNIQSNTSNDLIETLKLIKECESIPDINILAEVINQIIENDSAELTKLEELAAKNEKELEKLNIKIGEAEIILKAKSELIEAEKLYNEEVPKLKVLEKNLSAAALEYTFCDELSKNIGAEQEKLKNYDVVEVLTAEFTSLTSENNKNSAILSDLKINSENNAKKINQLKNQLEDLKNTESNKSILEKKNFELSNEFSNITELKKQFEEYQTIKENLQKIQNEFDEINNNYKNLKTEYDLKQEFFWKNQAGILALSLREKKPCPVCGSATHPSPAQLPDNAPDKSELDKLEEIITEEKNLLDKISSSAAHLSGQKENLKKSLLQKINDYFKSTDFKNAYELISNKLKELSSEISKTNLLINDVAKQCEIKKKIETQIPELENNQNVCLEKIKTYQNSATIYETKIHSLNTQIASLKKNLEFETKNDAKKKIDDLIKKLNLIEKNYAAAKDLYDICKKRIEETKVKIATLKKQISTSFEIDIEVLKQQKSVLTNEKFELENTLDILKLNILNSKNAAENISIFSKELLKAEEKYIGTSALSKTVNGSLTGKDRIKFETYVQMTYFERILARATKRLLKMSDGQYELRRSAEQIKGSQNGLEIEIIDHYNGTVRSVKTLSGGEAFKASLSLALALSDEIQEYSGGIKIDTMFIDEGFGSLDDESLNQALNALSDLSEGNRLIGIISHVSELKNRIDKKIIVTKNKSGGSSISFEL